MKRAFKKRISNRQYYMLVKASERYIKGLKKGDRFTVKQDALAGIRDCFVSLYGDDWRGVNGFFNLIQGNGGNPYNLGLLLQMEFDSKRHFIRHLKNFDEFEVVRK